MFKTFVKKQWKNILITIILLSIAFSVVAFGGNVNNSNGGVNAVAGSEEYSFTNVDLKSSYLVGDKINIGEVKLNYASKQYDADIIVYFPDGSAKMTHAVTLIDIGNYTIKFVSQVNGKLFSSEKTFVVTTNRYSVTGINSIVKYGVDESRYATGKDGLLLSLAQKDTFNVNKVIDLKKYKKGDKLFQAFLTPQTKGAYDARRFNVVLTDAYDPSIFIRIIIQCYPYDGLPWSYQNSYVAVDFTGYKTDNIFGIPTMHSFYACGYSSVGQEFITLAYDYDTSTIFANGTSHDEGARNLGCVTDSSVYSTTFPGFTTGEVLLSITGADYATASLSMVITDLAKADLSDNSMTYQSMSKINVDLLGYNQENLPCGLVNKTYPVFKASAINGYSKNVTLETKVFYNYNYLTRYELNITDCCFAPTKTGVYTIEYTAIDVFNNKSKKLVNIDIADSVTEIALNLSSEALLKKAYVGQNIAIGSFDNNVTVDETKFGVGILKYDTKVIFDNKEVKVKDSHFIPTAAGKYTVTYTVTDMIGQKAIKSYDIIITVDNKPVFTNPFTLPKYFVNKGSYTLPTVVAHDYVNNKDITAIIKIIDKNGATSLKSNVYKPDFTEDCTVQVVYEATNASGTTKSQPITVPVKVVKVNRKIDMKKYFNTENAVLKAENDHIAFSNNQAQKVSSEFINPILASAWSIKLAISASKNNFSSYDIYLVDSLDYDITVKLSVKKALTPSSYTYLFINDVQTSGYIKHGFYDDGMITLSYDSVNKAIRFGEFIAPIISTSKGEAFNGFSGKTLYTSFEFSQVTGASEVKLYKLSTNSFSSDTVEYSAPNIEVSGNNKVNYDINQEVTIFSAIAVDLMDIYTNITVTVKNTKGDVMTSLDGVKLQNVSCDKNYKIKLTEYGRYSIVYNYEDSANTGKFSYFVNAIDSIAPTITVSGESKNQAKIGDIFTIPTATATDNIDKEVIPYVLVSYPDGTIKVYDEAQIKLDKAGLYKLTYYAYDVAGNYSTITKTITVA